MHVLGMLLCYALNLVVQVLGPLQYANFGERSKVESNEVAKG